MTINVEPHMKRSELNKHCPGESAVLKLPDPTADLNVLWNLGVSGVPLPQYLKWADDADIFILMSDEEGVTVEKIVSDTKLSRRGADALLSLLTAMQLVTFENGKYSLDDVGRQYLDRRSPFYVGESLYAMHEKDIPRRLLKGESVREFSRTTGSLWYKLKSLRSKKRMGGEKRLQIQHSRNFAASVVASRTSFFDGITHLVDIGGGSGVFGIPLALEKRDLQVTLVELPDALPQVEKFLQKYGVDDRIKLQGINVHQTPWPIESCDGVLFGNFLHFCSDDEALALLREAFRLLPVNGRVLLHEMLWNDSRSGPLVTALWNFWLTSISAGGQRTKTEFTDLLLKAGFGAPEVTATVGGFSLLCSKKPG